jgi:transposase
LNSRKCNSDGFDERVKEICDIYKNAFEMHQKEIHIISIDEKTGIQALERVHKNLPMMPGSPEKIEHEYIRHGTQCLIGNLEVATGKILTPFVGDTRTEQDFLNNIKNVVSTDPEAQWVFIVDQLNTHKSESLVRWLANEIKYEGDLGKNGHASRKGKGILKSMQSRMDFLEDKTHRIRFLFTPKHCSWMNQIEIWFSGLSRRYLKRSSFSSIQELKQGILDFIAFFNENAKPFKWTYEGKVLQA